MFASHVRGRREIARSRQAAPLTRGMVSSGHRDTAEPRRRLTATRFCCASERASGRANAASENSLYALLHYHFCLPPPAKPRTRSPAFLPGCLTFPPAPSTPFVPPPPPPPLRLLELARSPEYLPSSRASERARLEKLRDELRRRVDGELLRASGPLLLTCRSKFEICAEERPLGIPRKPSQNGNPSFSGESEFFNRSRFTQ